MADEILSGAEIEDVQDAAGQVDEEQEIVEQPEEEQEVSEEETPPAAQEDEASSDEEGTRYKTQKEIDRAIGYRLKSAQDKWQKEHSLGIELERRYKTLYGGKPPDEILNEIDTQLINQMADRLGTTYEMAEWLYRHNQGDVISPPPQQQAQQEQQAFDPEFIDGLVQQEAAIKSKYPDFDLASTVESNPEFAQLLVNGVSVETAYNAVFPDKIKKQVETEVVNRIKTRNTRPSEIKNTSGSGVSVDINNLTDEQILELAQRARRGERIQL